MTGWGWAAPASAEELRALLDRHGGRARLVAGGTWLVPRVRARAIQPTILIGLHRVPGMTDIAVDGGGLRIGAGVTLRALETSPLIHGAAPVLAQAAGVAASLRVRAQATIGGNLAVGDPAFDLPPALIALDATATVSSPDGVRNETVESLVGRGDDEALGRGDVIMAIHVPARSSGARAAFEKFRPASAYDYATVNVAARLDRAADGRIEAARVAAGGVARSAIRLPSVEAALVGSPGDARTMEQAARHATADIDPMDDPRASAAYRRDMAVLWTRRTLLRLSDGAASG